jgi:hypothetical protein
MSLYRHQINMCWGYAERWETSSAYWPHDHRNYLSPPPISLLIQRKLAVWVGGTSRLGGRSIMCETQGESRLGASRLAWPVSCDLKRRASAFFRIADYCFFHSDWNSLLLAVRDAHGLQLSLNVSNDAMVWYKTLFWTLSTIFGFFKLDVLETGCFRHQVKKWGWGKVSTLSDASICG